MTETSRLMSAHVKMQRQAVIDLYEALVDNTPEFTCGLDDLIEAADMAGYHRGYADLQRHIAEMVGDYDPQRR